jgi:hypothetical protein
MQSLIVVLLLLFTCSSCAVNTKQSTGEPVQTEETVPVYFHRTTALTVLKEKETVVQEDDTWQLKTSEEGIPVYTRKVAGSPILAYKANVILDVPIAKAIALFEDESQIHRWYFQCVHSELVEKKSPKEEIIYLVLHLPWPVAPRDFVFKRTRTEDAVSGTISYTLTALPDRLPPVKGIIRVATIESVWQFRPLPNGKTNFSFQQHTDPVGSIPPSIVNKLAVQTPFNSLKNFRDLVSDKKA